jgi:hypothetical protein
LSTLSFPPFSSYTTIFDESLHIDIDPARWQGKKNAQTLHQAYL